MTMLSLQFTHGEPGSATFITAASLLAEMSFVLNTYDIMLVVGQKS